jgi:hypothetical protein
MMIFQKENRMMKKLDLRHKALSSENGESIFGAADTGSHACYMIYGILKAGEKHRLIRPGKGHEEMVLVVKGSLTASGHLQGRLEEGSAFHVVGDVSVFLENTESTESVYVVAGAHAAQGHHH